MFFGIENNPNIILSSLEEKKNYKVRRKLISTYKKLRNWTNSCIYLTSTIESQRAVLCINGMAKENALPLSVGRYSKREMFVSVSVNRCIQETYE